MQFSLLFLVVVFLIVHLTLELLDLELALGVVGVEPASRPTLCPQLLVHDLRAGKRATAMIFLKLKLRRK